MTATVSLELECDADGCDATEYRGYWTALTYTGILRGARVLGWEVRYRTDEQGRRIIASWCRKHYRLARGRSMEQYRRPSGPPRGTLTDALPAPWGRSHAQK